MSDQFSKFTKEAKQALIVAQEVAKKTGTNYVRNGRCPLVFWRKNSLGSVLHPICDQLDNVNLVLKTVGRTQNSSTRGQNPGDFLVLPKKVIEDAVRSAQEFSTCL